MKKYSAVLFDLFGTVALFDREQLPLFAWNGQTSRSTMAGLRLLIAQEMPQLDFAQFLAALTEVNRELAEERAREMREFSSGYRFLLALTRVGLEDGEDTRRFAEALSQRHMALLAAATTIPRTHVELLAHLYRTCRTAVVSNFDHAPTARAILRTGGAISHFHQITISDEHGWRKPHPRIFADTLAALGVPPHEALFVGDSPQDDIVGAKRVGMDVAWVNASGGTVPAEVPAPEYIVRAIPELRALFT
ncbi:MAG: HAD family hydrolase [Candidatus Binatia bacterium]|nr:HAD family hydrolase [Candidatus Binatia bacterium]